jgi:uncharacterized protein with PQ loop repeat
MHVDREAPKTIDISFEVKRIHLHLMKEKNRFDVMIRQMCRNVWLIQRSVEILTWMMQKVFHGSSLPLCTLEIIYICFGTITIFYYLTMHYKVSYHHLRSGKTEGWRLKDRGFRFLPWRIFVMHQIPLYKHSMRSVQESN